MPSGWRRLRSWRRGGADALTHHPRKYSIGEAIAAVELACRVFSAEEMRNRVEFL